MNLSLILSPLVGLAIGLSLGAQLQLHNLKREVEVVAKIMLDQNNRCVCVEKK